MYENETSELASLVIRKVSLAEGGGVKPMVLHSDNGSPMKGTLMIKTFLHIVRNRTDFFTFRLLCFENEAQY